MLNDTSYVTIQAFMVNNLQLKGNELIVYAVIFGYTQDGEHWFYGTRGHLANWCGASKGTVSNCIASLLEKGYIRKKKVTRHGIVENHYQAVLEILNNLPKISTPPTKNYDTPLPKISSNNIKGNNNKEIEGPALAEVVEYMVKNGATKQYAERFYSHYASQGWRKGNGLAMHNWQAAAWYWLSRDNIEPKKEHPQMIDCTCGGKMRITASSQIATGKPYYRCETCGREALE